LSKAENPNYQSYNDMFFLLFCSSVSSPELVKSAICFMLGKEILVEEQEYLSSVFSKINFLIVIKKQITIDRPM